MKCYIIRLEGNDHSVKMAQECYDQAVKFNLQPEFFNAINGLDAKKHYELTRIKAKRKLKKGRPGVIGCFFSHYYLWLKCVELKEPIIILEHDGYILKHISSDILNQFNDVLKLDRLDPYSNRYNESLDSESNLDLTIKKYINPTPKNPIKLGTGNYFKGAYAYIIKPQGAHKLIKHIQKEGHITADQQIGDWVLETNTTIPSLARLHPFYSIGNNIKTHSLTQNLEKHNETPN